jgi:hypothetical protein
MPVCQILEKMRWSSVASCQRRRAWDLCSEQARAIMRRKKRVSRASLRQRPMILAKSFVESLLWRGRHPLRNNFPRCWCHSPSTDPPSQLVLGPKAIPARHSSFVIRHFSFLDVPFSACGRQADHARKRGSNPALPRRWRRHCGLPGFHPAVRGCVFRR